LQEWQYEEIAESTKIGMVSLKFGQLRTFICKFELFSELEELKRTLQSLACGKVVAISLLVLLLFYPIAVLVSSDTKGTLLQEMSHCLLLLGRIYSV
jgi:hypothetical protein